MNEFMRGFDVGLVHGLVEDLRITELGSNEIERAEEFGDPDSDSDFGADFFEGLTDGSGWLSEDSSTIVDEDEGTALEGRVERLEKFVRDEVGWMSRYRAQNGDFEEVSECGSDC